VILTVNIQNDNYTDLVTQACKEMFDEVQSTLPDLTIRCSDGKFFHTHKQLFMLVDNDFRSVLISDPEIKNVIINTPKSAIESCLELFTNNQENGPGSTNVSNDAWRTKIHTDLVPVENNQSSIVTNDIPLEHDQPSTSGNEVSLEKDQPSISTSERPSEKMNFEFLKSNQISQEINHSSTASNEPLSNGDTIEDSNKSSENCANETKMDQNENEIGDDVTVIVDGGFVKCPASESCPKTLKLNQRRIDLKKRLRHHIATIHFDTVDNELSLKENIFKKNGKCQLCTDKKEVIKSTKDQQKHILSIHKPYEKLIVDFLPPVDKDLERKKRYGSKVNQNESSKKSLNTEENQLNILLKREQDLSDSEKEEESDQ